MGNNSTPEKRIQDLEKRIVILESRVSKLENSGTLSSQTSSNSILTKLTDKFDEIGQQNIVIIALKINPRQTEEQLISIIEGWGIPIKKWFQTTNFQNRLVKKGLVNTVGKNDDEKEIFSLTEVKGNKFADELIKKYSS